jgi:hypothetical protein
MASQIASARFVELDGDDHWFFAGAQQPVIEAVERFVAKDRPLSAQRHEVRRRGSNSEIGLIRTPSMSALTPPSGK